MVTLLERSLAQPRPNIFPIHCPGHLKRNLQVTALNREIEPCLLVLHKVERNLGVALLLQVPDDTLTNQVGSSNDLEYLIVVLANERELESVLGWVDSNSARLGGSVETVHDLTLDASEVNGLVERLDDTIITVNCQLAVSDASS